MPDRRRKKYKLCEKDFFPNRLFINHFLKEIEKSVCWQYSETKVKISRKKKGKCSSR